MARPSPATPTGFTHPCPRLSTDRSALGGFAASAGKQASKNLAHMALTVGRPRRAEKRSAFRHRRASRSHLPTSPTTYPATVRRRKALRFSALRGRPTVNAICAKNFNPEEARRATQGHGEGIDALLRAVPEPTTARSAQIPCFSVALRASSVLQSLTCLRCSQRPGRITGARRPPRVTIGECRSPQPRGQRCLPWSGRPPLSRQSRRQAASPASPARPARFPPARRVPGRRRRPVRRSCPPASPRRWCSVPRRRRPPGRKCRCTG